MAIVKNMQGILNKYKEGFDKAWADYNQAAELHKQERMTGRMLDEKRKERNAALLELTRTANEQITAECKKYVDALPGRYAKDPDKIDANTLAMLNSAASGVIELTPNDIDSLFKKFDGNLTMQGAISEFVTKHDAEAKITFFSEKQRNEDAISYAGGCRRCLSTSPEDPNLPMTFAYYCEGTRAVPPSLIGE